MAQLLGRGEGGGAGGALGGRGVRLSFWAEVRGGRGGPGG